MNHRHRHRLALFGIVGAIVICPGGMVSAHAQVLFLEKTRNAGLTASPLLVSIHVDRELQASRTRVAFVLDGPRKRLDSNEAVYLLWPGGIVEPQPQPPAPQFGGSSDSLQHFVESRGYELIRAGNVALRASSLTTTSGRAEQASVLPYVTFARPQLTKARPVVTLIRIPWTDALVDKSFIHSIEFRTEDFVRRRTATWFEEALQGRRHTAKFAFFNYSNRVAFGIWFEHRDRLIPLGGDSPHRISVSFADADDLRVENIDPPTARIARSEVIEMTDEIHIPVDASAPAQFLDIKFAYFRLFRAIATAVGFFVFSQFASWLFAATIKGIGRSIQRLRNLRAAQADQMWTLF